MRTITKDEFLINKDFYLNEIKQGKIYIHPTDTIYGLGCNAKDKDAVKRIRKAKKRKTQPFSVIAPSKDWIRENCEITKVEEEYLDKLPGKYTLILKLKNKDAIAKNVAPKLNSIGVRIPNHWFSQVANELNLPLITTSANKVGDDFMTSIENLDPKIHSKVHHIFYEGEKKNTPSKLIKFDKEKVEIHKR